MNTSQSPQEGNASSHLSQNSDASSRSDQSHHKRSTRSHTTNSILMITLITTFVTTGILSSFVYTGSYAHAAATTASVHTIPLTSRTTKRASSTLTGAQKFNQRLLALAATYTSPFQTTPQVAPHTQTQQTVKPKTTTATTSYNGLGDLPFYTYVSSQQLTDQVAMKVNVANGNVLLNTSELNITGTGINLGVGSIYNSEENSSSLLDDGNMWFFNIGRVITLDLSNVANGITLTEGSGFTTFFKADSTNANGFDDAPGLNESIQATGNGTYTITFNQTGEQWGFNSYGTFLIDGDKNGNAIQYNYGSNGDLTSIVDTQGRTITINHGTDANNNLHQITSYTVTTTDGTSKTITHGYTAFALTSLTNADQKTTSFQYDTAGRITKITDPLSHSTSFAYTTAGQIATITDANNLTTQFTYNASTDSACSGIVPSGAPALPCTVVTDQRGNKKTYAYNSVNFIIEYIKDALGHVSAQAIDNSTYKVQSLTDPLQNVTKFTYDNNNNVTTLTDPTGATIKTTYTSISQAYYPLTYKDTQGNTTNYAYDLNGNLTSTTDASKHVVTYSYNSNGNGTPISQTDADGHITTYAYDTNGNLITMTPPAPMGTTTMTYDQLSRLKTETDGNGHTTTYTYDNEDRITNITYSGTPTPSVNYTYDAAGNILTQVDGTGTTTHTYDALNRQLTMTLPSGTIEADTYDGVGNLTSFNDGIGTTTYTYNADDLMVTLTDPGNAVSNYGYDNDNNRTCIIYPNGTGMLLTYDADGRELTNTGGKTGSSSCSTSTTIVTPMTGYSYTYGSATNPTYMLQSATIHAAGNYTTAVTSTYTYDSQNRLTQVTNPNQTWTVGYDANNNIMSKTYAGASTFNASFTYNNDNELTSASATGTNAASASYNYDSNGNLTNVTNGTSGAGPLSLAQTHTYNTTNQDTSGTGIATGLSSSYSYGYSGTDQMSRISNNGKTSVYTSMGLSTEQTSATNTNEYVRCSCGILNSERTSAGKVYYYLFDGIGSIVGMTDSTGALVATYGYDPFGNVGGGSVQSGVINPWGYAGGYTDTITGLIKFGIRYYDPRVGRWTQATPIGGSLQEATRPDPYVYANDNPINNIDPSGSWTMWIHFGWWDVGVKLRLYRNDLESYNEWMFVGIILAVNIVMAYLPWAIPEAIQNYIGQDIWKSMPMAKSKCLRSNGGIANIYFMLSGFARQEMPTIICGING